MPPSLPQPTEQEWLKHKARIRRLYIVDNFSLKSLVAELGPLGLAVTSSQLEYKLKQWGLRKNIEKAAWRVIDQKIAKRKQKGKASEVIHCGKRIKQTTVEKERNRHRDMSIFARLNPSPSPPPSPINSQLMVCTPPALNLEFEWPTTLPWFKFQSIYSNFTLSITRSRRDGTDQATNSLVLQPARVVSLVSSRPPGGQYIQRLPKINNLATLLGRSMPESYPGENLQRAHSLLTGSGEDVVREGLTSFIFSLSNGMLNLLYWDNWMAAMTILRACGSPHLDFRASFGDVHSFTLRGLMENLFSAAMYWIHAKLIRNTFEEQGDEERAALDRGNILALIKMLLSSGVSPDHVAETYWIPPLALATQHGDLEMMVCLLESGANVNILDADSSTPLQYALRSSCDSGTVSQMVELLLQHGASVNLDEALHQAIRTRRLHLVEPIVQQGASLKGAVKSTRWFPRETSLQWENVLHLVYEETVLSTAASTGLSETQSILDLLAVKYPTEPVNTFVTADVLIAAAYKGRTDSIRLLYSVCNDVTSRNAQGMTALSPYTYISSARPFRHSQTNLLLYQPPNFY